MVYAVNYCCNKSLAPESRCITWYVDNLRQEVQPLMISDPWCRRRQQALATSIVP